MKTKNCKCGLSFPKNLMVGKKCYICTLKMWPPKNQFHVKKYKKAVSIRLSLASPLNLKQSTVIVDKLGLEKLMYIQQVIEGKIIPLKPNSTFYQRLINLLEVNQ